MLLIEKIIRNVVDGFLDAVQFPININTNYFRDNMLKLATVLMKYGIDARSNRVRLFDILFSVMYDICPELSSEWGKIIPKCIDKIDYYQRIMSDNYEF